MMKKITLFLTAFFAVAQIYAQCNAPTLTIGAITDTTVEVTVSQIPLADENTDVQISVHTPNFTGSADVNRVGGRPQINEAELASADSADRTVIITGLTPGTSYQIVPNYFCNPATSPPRNFGTPADVTTTGAPPAATFISFNNEASDATIVSGSTAIPFPGLGNSFDVSFTVNTDIATSVDVSLNVVGFSGGGLNSFDIVSTTISVAIPDTGGVDQDITATLTFPATSTLMDGGITWTLDPSQTKVDRNNGNNLTGRLRNDTANARTNYRIVFTTSAESPALGGLPSDPVDTLISNDADGDGVTMADGDRCPATPPADAASVETDDTNGRIGCATGETLSVSEFTRADILNLVTSANPVVRTIELTKAVDYSVFSITGVKVKSGTNARSIDVETLTSGLYFLATNEGVYKFLKK